VIYSYLRGTLKTNGTMPRKKSDTKWSGSYTISCQNTAALTVLPWQGLHPKHCCQKLWFTTGQPGNEDSILAKSVIFLFHAQSRPAMGPDKTLTQWIPSGKAPGIQSRSLSSI